MTLPLTAHLLIAPDAKLLVCLRCGRSTPGTRCRHCPTAGTGNVWIRKVNCADPSHNDDGGCLNLNCWKNLAIA